MAAAAVPEVALRSGNARPMPAVGMGTVAFPLVHEATKDAVLAAIEVGFRHFDTAAMYGTEKPLGDAAAEAVRRGLVQSRADLFVTSKLWCTQNHPDLVLPSLRETLRNLQMEYLDLYLIHWPVAIKPGPPTFPKKKEDAVPFDVEGVWRAMEECQRLGLAKAIGVSNFTTKHLDKLLAVATIPPAVNQVALRWIYEQGVTPIVKSHNKERLKQNLEIFDRELTTEDRFKISQIPQNKLMKDSTLFLQEGEFTSVDPADLDNVEE